MRGNRASSAGVNDLMRGADRRAASDDIPTMGAVVHALNEEDLEDVIEIGAISGELAVLSDVLAAMAFDTMSEFLLSRSQRLRELAVDNILRYGAVRALSESLHETSATVGALGEEEVAEGEARLDLAEAAAANSQALAEAGGACLLYTSPSPRARTRSRMPPSALQKKNTTQAHRLTPPSCLLST